MFYTNSEYELLKSEYEIDGLCSITKGNMKFAQNFT